MPLISIVIPTCDRPDYLIKVISLIESNLNDYELIIADNSKTDNLKK
ncbi:glycosyltransferase family 2 protein, partial [Vibrio vulnificus]|nr:glycosyltransferase family 2 protein [Vibrio vulnificus]